MTAPAGLTNPAADMAIRREPITGFDGQKLS
jgi:hypothetical protein